MSGSNSILNLLFSADVTGLTKAQDELKKTQEATKNLSKEQVGFLDQLKKTTTGLTDFSKETDKVAGSLKSAISSFNPVTMAVSALTAGIAALSFGALKDMVMGVVNTRAEMYHLSQQTGISVEALSGLRNVALLTGTSMDEVAQLTTKFNQSVASADRPTSLQAEAFKNLGVQLKDQNGHFKDTITLQQEAARTLNNHSDGIEKDAYYMAIWGKGAIQNKEYLKNLGEQTEITGKLTAEQAKKAADLEVQLRLLGKATNEFKNALAEELVPWLLQATTEVNNLLRAAGSLKGAFHNIDLLGEGGNVLKAKLDEVEKDIANRKKSWNNMAEWGRGDEKDFNEGIKQLETRANAIRKLMQIETDYASNSRKTFAATDPRRVDLGTDIRPTLKNIKDKELGGNLPEVRDNPIKGDLTKEAQDIIKLNAELSKLKGQYVGVSEALIEVALAEDKYKEKRDGKGNLTQRGATDDEKKVLRTAAAQKDLIQIEIEAQKAQKKLWEEAEKQVEAENKKVTALRKSNEETKIARNVLAEYGKTQDDVDIALTEHAINEAELALQIANATGATEQEVYALKEKIAALKETKGIQEDRRDDNAAFKASQETFSSGWKKAFNDFKTNAENSANSGKQIFDSMSNSMTNAIVNFAKTGKFSFKDFASSIINDMIQIEARKMAAGIMGTLGGFLGLANGGAFAGGKKLFASGDVFNRPTDFTYSGGVGQLGEAGPEGVLPLRRNSAGQLGVMSSGGGGTTQVNNITVNVQGGKDPQQTGDIVAAAVVERISRGVAKQEIARASRVGGMLNPI